MAPKFTGFYLFLRDKQDEVDFMTWQFSTQLMSGLRAYQLKHVESFKKDLLIDKPPDNDPGSELRIQITDDEFVLFRGNYVKAFTDGSMLFKILQIIISTLGDTPEPLVEKEQHYKSQGKSAPALRASYWYIDNNFVSQLPADYQVAFTVDCLLYGEWQVQHPNLIGLHLLALAWMLGEKQFLRYVPPGMATCPQIVEPIFRQFLPLVGLQIRYGNVSTQPEKDGQEKEVQKNS